MPAALIAVLAHAQSSPVLLSVRIQPGAPDADQLGASSRHGPVLPHFGSEFSSPVKSQKKKPSRMLEDSAEWPSHSNSFCLSFRNFPMQGSPPNPATFLPICSFCLTGGLPGSLSETAIHQAIAAKPPPFPESPGYPICSKRRLISRRTPSPLTTPNLLGTAKHL